MPQCKVCRGRVTEGKMCALCHQPVCGDHRTKVGAGAQKVYYCRTPCGGRGIPQPGPSPYAPGAGYPAAQQQQQQQQQQQHHYQPPPPAQGPPQASYATPNSQPYANPQPSSSTAHHPAAFGSPLQFGGSGGGGGGGGGVPSPSSHWQESGGGSPYPAPQQPPPGPSPAAAAPSSSSSSAYGGSFGGPPARTGDSPTPATDEASNRRRFGLGCGGPLPTVPAADQTGHITVQLENGTVCAVLDDPDAVSQLTGAYVTERRLKRQDTIEHTDSATGERRRGVIVGVSNGGLVVLERRRAVGHGWSDIGALVTSPQLPSLKYLQLGRCRHCGCLIPLDEARLHVDMAHKATEGSTTRIDTETGVCVGNVELLLGLKPIRRLGEGAQGTVSMCQPPPGVEVAADVRMQYYVRKDIACANEEEAVGRYQQAVRIMALKHPHVIRYLAVQRTPVNDFVRVVMPYYPEDDLNKTIRNAKDRLPEDWILSVILQLATALQYLHSHSPPILHGDLKPENVLLFNQKNQVILMDFDTSVEVHRHGPGTARANAGTMEWMAPEAVRGQRLTVNSDVWSLGLMAYVLAVLPEFPMLQNERGEVCLLNSSDWHPDTLRTMVGNCVRQRHYSSGFTALVQDMMACDPKSRPTAATAVDRITGLMEALLLGQVA